MNIWRSRLSRILDPVARACPLSPNTISVIALFINLSAAGCLLAGPTRPPLFLVAVFLIALGGLADALDGVVARVQQKESQFGDFLDHVADRISDTSLGACWLMANDVREPLVVVAVILAMLNGYIGTQIQATFGERSYDELGRGEFVLALIVFPIVSYILFTHGWSAIRFGGATVAEWLALLLVAFGIVGIVQRFALAHRKGRT